MSKTLLFLIDLFLIEDILYLVHAYGRNGKGKEAIELFNRIPLEMINESIYICVLNACSHSGLIEEGEKIFNMIPDQQRTEKIYTSMVSNIFYLIQSV